MDEERQRCLDIVKGTREVLEECATPGVIVNADNVLRVIERIIVDGMPASTFLDVYREKMREETVRLTPPIPAPAPARARTDELSAYGTIP